MQISLNTAQLTVLALGTACAAHWAACFLFYLANLPDAALLAGAPWGTPNIHSSAAGRYTRALYWSLFGFFQGHLDVFDARDGAAVASAVEWEVWWGMAINVLSMMVRTYTIAQATILLFRSQTSTDEYRKGLEVLERFLSVRNVRPELAKRVKAHYQRQHDKHEQDDDERVVPMLPRSMQAELLTDMYYACLASSPLFMPSHDAALIAATCQYLRREVWQKGDTLIKQGAFRCDLLFLAEGQVEIVQADQDEEEARGDDDADSGCESPSHYSRTSSKDGSKDSDKDRQRQIKL